MVHRCRSIISILKFGHMGFTSKERPQVDVSAFVAWIFQVDEFTRFSLVFFFPKKIRDTETALRFAERGVPAAILLQAGTKMSRCCTFCEIQWMGFAVLAGLNSDRRMKINCFSYF